MSFSLGRALKRFNQSSLLSINGLDNKRNGLLNRTGKGNMYFNPPELKSFFENGRVEEMLALQKLGRSFSLNANRVETLYRCQETGSFIKKNFDSLSGENPSPSVPEYSVELVGRPEENLSVAEQLRLAKSVDLMASTVVVFGATADCFNNIAIELLERGAHVVGVARREVADEQSNKFQGSRQLRYEILGNNRISSSVMVENLLKETLVRGIRQGRPNLSVINLIGSSRSSEGKTLLSANGSALMAQASAVRDIMREFDLEIPFVHVSSCAPSWGVDSSYPRIKNKCDEILLKHLNAIVIRLPLIYPNPETGSDDKIRFEKPHANSPETFSNLFIQPVLGSGKQRLQLSSVTDIAHGVANAAERVLDRNGVIIDAVHDEELSQEEIATSYRNLVGKKARIFNVPYEVAEWVTHPEHDMGEGRLAEYAVGLFKILEEGPRTLDGSGWREVLGREPEQFREIMTRVPGKNYILPGPMLGGQVKKVLKGVVTFKEARKKIPTLLANTTPVMARGLLGLFRKDNTNESQENTNS